MRSFKHHDARSINEAVDLLMRYQGRARLNAGGSDLLDVLKGDFLPAYPEAVINIKNIGGLDYVKEEDGRLKIGALTRLTDIARSPAILHNYPAIPEAIALIASPQIRAVATIGGNLCQDVRCWYYRYPSHVGGAMDCARKGKGVCLAIKGDNRYHAIMGGKTCFAVCPSDLAVVLKVFDAEIRVVGPQGERNIAVAEFFHPMGNALQAGEVVREVSFAIREITSHQAFLKFTLRKAIDFAIVSVAALVETKNGTCTDARLVLGAVAPGPVRALSAEEKLVGKTITAQVAAAAAEAAVEGARPLSGNAYKLQITRTLVQRAILREPE